MRPTLVLVDLSNVAQCCWHPAIAAYEAGEKAWAEHKASCALCREHAFEVGGVHPACEAAPKRYDLQAVYRENLNLKTGTLTESLGVGPLRWVMVKDSRPVARYQVFPEYKGNRVKKDDYGDPRPVAEEVFRSKGCAFVIAPDHEADDCIAAFTLAYKGTHDVVIVSSDKDLWQLLDAPTVRVFSPTLKLFIGPERLEKAFQVSEPRHVRLCKALWGDSGDNIPNAVPRMQKPLLPLVKSSDGTLDDFLRKAAVADLSPRCRELLRTGIDQVTTNYFLAGLMSDCAVEAA